jgi:hypothetical protein
VAASNLPIFPDTPAYGVANISSAFTARTTTGVTSLTSVLAAGADGTVIDRVRIVASATTTAGMVRLWVYAGSGNAQLLHEEPVSAITPSATVAVFSTEVVLENLVLPTGYTLYASTHNAEAFNVFAFGGHY